MKQKKIPMRLCVGCMVSKPKKELIRITAVDNMAKPDYTGKANGRGIYLCKNEQCLMLAKKRKAINRALKLELSEEQFQLFKEELKLNEGENS